ncbi:hypothetical protein KKE60_08525 [Patescibacteria group bacterium]|nr:hypothetical protein [Patescibacteria group bacterium]
MPKKLFNFGETHIYRIDRVPVELADRVKVATKKLLRITVSDYLRERVIEAGRFKAMGRKYNRRACNMVPVDFNVPWIKQPNMIKVHTYIHYPKQEWDQFVENCLVWKSTPRREIIRFMIELAETHREFRAMEKRRKAKKKRKTKGDQHENSRVQT